MKRFLTLLAIIILLLAMTACGGKVTVVDVLANSASTMSQIDTVQFDLVRQGDPVTVELVPGTPVDLISAAGSYQAPDSAYAIVKAQAFSLVVEAEVIWGTDMDYFKAPPPLGTDFQEVDLSAFDIGKFFGQEGLAKVLRDDLSEPLLAGEEDLDGVPTYLVQADASASALSSVIGNVFTGETVALAIWIDKETYEVVRIVVTEENGSGWQLDLYGYGEPVEIPTP